MILAARTGGDKSVAVNFADESPDRSRQRDGDSYPNVHDLHQAALEFRSWGWSVFPLGRNKLPVVGWRRFQVRRPTDRELGRLFDRNGVGGLAVVTGSVSGGSDWVLACRDFDTADAYQGWAASNPGRATALPTVRTARGFHVYCRLRGPDTFVKYDDGELRASRRHYVALPPSRHPSGRLYRWHPHRPDSLRDFPVLSPADTGFLAGTPSRTVREDTPPFSTPESTEEPPNGLCPLSASVGLDLLPEPVREAVLRSQPVRAGQREDRLLYLARSLADIGRGIPPAHWLQAVLCWWRLARPVIGTKGFPETWAAFARAWKRGEVSVSASRPLRVMAAAAATATDPEDKLRAACRAKAADSPDGRFYLSCRTAGRLCGLQHTRAAEVLRGLVGSGFLRVVEPGTQGSQARRATVYRLGAA